MDLTPYKNDCNTFLDTAALKLDGVPPAELGTFLAQVGSGIEEIFQNHVHGSMFGRGYLTLMYQITRVVGVPRDSRGDGAYLTKDAVRAAIYSAMNGIKGLPDDTEKLRPTS